MSSDAILILGKLFLTFGVLLGLPLIELWRLRRVDTACLWGLARPADAADREREP